MPEPLTPRDVASINGKGRFVTAGDPVLPIVFSAS
jgi:hypothetical protein